MKVLKISTVLIVLLIGVLSAQPVHDELRDEPLFTKGNTNEIFWRLEDGTSPVMYRIWVDSAAVGYPDFEPDGVGHDVLIEDIPAGDSSIDDHPDGWLSRIVGLGRAPGSPADAGLRSGIRYCYYVEYQVEHGGSWITIPDTICSTQDATPPVIVVDSLPEWVPASGVDITFSSEDMICSCAESARLYYKVEPDTSRSDLWILYDEIETGCGGAGSSYAIPFVAEPTAGTLLHLFRVIGIDSLGNVGDASPELFEMAWTHFDIEMPISIITSPDSADRYYYTTGDIDIHYDAQDTVSGLYKVDLKWRRGTGGMETFPRPGIYRDEDDPVFSVTDAIFEVRSMRDGRYRFWTQATDIAGNVEEINEGEHELVIEIDRHDPELDDATTAYDTTTVPHMSEVPAESGWTNDRYIMITAEDSRDPLTDGYASGLETVTIASNGLFTLDPMTHTWIDDDYSYIVTSGDGMKNLFIKLKDMAGNESEVLSRTIKLDEEHPALLNVRLADPDRPLVPTETVTPGGDIYVDITPDTLSGSFYKMYVTDDYDELASIERGEWEDYSPIYYYPLEPSEVDIYKELWVVVKDSAGNVSEPVMDSIYVIPAAEYYVDILSISDVDGPDETRLKYTDAHEVIAKIRVGGDVDSVTVEDDRDWDTTFAVSLDTASTFDFPVRFSDGDNGIRYLTAYGDNFRFPGPTDESVDSIVLDTRDPMFDDLIVFDRTGEDDVDPDTSVMADAGYTNDPLVFAEFETASDPCFVDECSGLYYIHLEAREASLDEPINFPSFIHSFELGSDEGEFNVYGAVQDSAGNWSNRGEQVLTLDTTRPIITSMSIADTSGSEEYTNEQILRIDLDFVDEDEYKYVTFYENPARYPSTLSDVEWREYDDRMTYELTRVPEEGEVVMLYACVKDRSGNVSALSRDSITYQEGISLDLVLRDRDSDNTEYTNEATVIAQLNWSGNIPEAYYLSHENVPPDPTSTDWRPYPSSGDTLHTFYNADEGLKTVYGWLKSSSGDISPVSIATITLDMTAPVLDSGFELWDTTEEDDFPIDFVAHMGWSNEVEAYAYMDEVTDEHSDVAKVGFFRIGDIQNELWGAGDPSLELVTVDSDGEMQQGVAVDYVPDNATQIQFSDDFEGSREIIGRALDLAGNWGNVSDPNSQIIIDGGYDTQPPTFHITDQSFNIVDSLGVTLFMSGRPSSIPCQISDIPDEGHIWKVCIKFMTGDDPVVCSEIDSTWDRDGNNYWVKMDLSSVLEVDKLYDIQAVAIDSAGNPSALVEAKLWTVPEEIVFEFSLTDQLDTDDTEYTNNPVVRTVIDIPGAPERMMFSQFADFRDGEWEDFNEFGTFELSNTINELKTVYAKVWHLDHGSESREASIILDTRSPTVNTINIFDQTTDDPDYSDELEVRIEIDGASDPPPGEVAALKCSEYPDFTDASILDFTLEDPVVYYTALEEPALVDETLPPGEEDARVVYAVVLDRAENESHTVTNSIIIDLDDTEVSNHPNPFNPNDEHTFIRVRSSDLGKTISVSIYDPFGNLVIEMDDMVADDSRLVKFDWDGTNGEGDVVASGAYIAIVEIGDEVFKRKIAVWKGGE